MLSYTLILCAFLQTPPGQIQAETESGTFTFTSIPKGWKVSILINEKKDAVMIIDNTNNFHLGVTIVDIVGNQQLAHLLEHVSEEPLDDHIFSPIYPAYSGTVIRALSRYGNDHLILGGLAMKFMELDRTKAIMLFGEWPKHYMVQMDKIFPALIEDVTFTLKTKRKGYGERL